MFLICDLEILGQGHTVQYSQWYHLMANINLLKDYNWAFFASSHHIQDIHISKLVTLKMKVKVMMHNICSDDIRRQNLTS